MTSRIPLPFIELRWKLNLSIEDWSENSKNISEAKRNKTVNGYIGCYQNKSPSKAQEVFWSALHVSETNYQCLSFSDYYVSSQYFIIFCGNRR